MMRPHDGEEEKEEEEEVSSRNRVIQSGRD
jgi:hypothetical protein